MTKDDRSENVGEECSSCAVREKKEADAKAQKALRDAEAKGQVHYYYHYHHDYHHSNLVVAACSQEKKRREEEEAEARTALSTCLERLLSPALESNVRKTMG